MLNQEQSRKESLRGKRQLAGWDESYLKRAVFCWKALELQGNRVTGRVAKVKRFNAPKRPFSPNSVSYDLILALFHSTRFSEN